MKVPTAMQIAALLWTCAAASPAADLNLKLDPELKIVREAIPGQKQQSLVATIPLARGSEGGCVVECDLAITAAWYYAPLRIGVRSADSGSAIVLHFEKRDREDNQCILFIRDSGKEREIAAWKNVECAKYRLALQWLADGKVRFHLRQGRLYAFWVSPDPSGASHGYVAAGGPEFNGPVDNVGGK
jgi:hypothetical protein